MTPEQDRAVSQLLSLRAPRYRKGTLADIKSGKPAPTEAEIGEYWNLVVDQALTDIDDNLMASSLTVQRPARNTTSRSRRRSKKTKKTPVPVSEIGDEQDPEVEVDDDGMVSDISTQRSVDGDYVPSDSGSEGVGDDSSVDHDDSDGGDPLPLNDQSGSPLLLSQKKGVKGHSPPLHSPESVGEPTPLLLPAVAPKPKNKDVTAPVPGKSAKKTKSRKVTVRAKDVGDDTKQGGDSAVGKSVSKVKEVDDGDTGTKNRTAIVNLLDLDTANILTPGRRRKGRGARTVGDDDSEEVDEVTEKVEKKGRSLRKRKGKKDGGGKKRKGEDDRGGKKGKKRKMDTKGRGN